jgi:hypothetical protein
MGFQNIKTKEKMNITFFICILIAVVVIIDCLRQTEDL